MTLNGSEREHWYWCCRTNFPLYGWGTSDWVENATGCFNANRSEHIFGYSFQYQYFSLHTLNTLSVRFHFELIDFICMETKNQFLFTFLCLSLIIDNIQRSSPHLLVYCKLCHVSKCKNHEPKEYKKWGMKMKIFLIFENTYKILFWTDIINSSQAKVWP